MAAILHALDQRRLIDSNGIADGSSIAFYTTGTLTPATIYSDSGLTTPLTNPVVVASGAAVPNIYLDDTVTYRRVITYSDGSTDDTDPYTAPWAAQGATVPAVIDNTDFNIFAGTGAGNSTQTSLASTSFGYDALNDLTSGQLNTMFGARAGQKITSGGVNSGFGTDALATCTTGEYNDAFGCKALTNLTTGARNKAFGQSCLLRVTTGTDNVGMGQDAGINVLDGSHNICIGSYALDTNASGLNNIAIGTNSQRYSTGSYNISIGRSSLFSNSTGEGHFAAGYDALYDNTTGGNTVAIGDYAMRSQTTGGNNVAVGFRAGYAAAGNEGSVVDTECTFVGYRASRHSSVATATPIVNSTALGHEAKVTKSNQVVLGHTTVTETVLRGVVQGTTYTVASLPTGAAGMRAFVTDANATTFASTVAGGGANGVPVYHNGTNWCIG